MVPLQTALALGLALLINQPIKAMPLFRTLFFMPVVFPMSLVAVVWTLIYAPDANGLMNQILRILTLGLWQAKDFLHDPLLALPALMLLSIWQGVGFQMIIILSGLQAIPSTLYEAAALDGSNRWDQFCHVTLPQLRNTLIFVMLVTSILAFRLFDQVEIMTPRGADAGDDDGPCMKQSKRHLNSRKMAKGAAMSVVFFLIVLAITLLQRRFVKEERVIE